MNFTTGYILTKAGEALQAKAESGTELKLTKMQLGSGTAVSVDDYYERTALIEPKNAMSISEIKQVTTEKNLCVAIAVLTNAAVDTSYTATELGLFAQDTDGTEILYAVSYDSNPTYIASKDDGTDITMKFYMYIVSTSDINITLTLPKTAEEIATVAAGYAAKAAESEAKAKQLEATANNYLQTTQQAMTLANGYANISKAWAEGNASPDGVADTDSPTGYTQSAKTWAALSKEYAGMSKFKLPIAYYNSVAEMRASETALAGRPCVTLGYYQPNDGGGSVYLIRAKTDNDADDGGSILVLDNGNVAELLVDGEVNVKQFGAKGDGTTDDLNPITKSIDLYSTIRIPDGKFYVSNSIFVNKSHKKILLSKNAYIFTGEKTTSTGGTLQIIGAQIMAGNTPKSEDEITSYIEDIYISGGHIYNEDKTGADNVIGMGTVKDCIIENVTIDRGGRKGITAQYGGKNIKIKNCTIRNCMCGISIEHFGSDIIIDGNTITNISVGATNNYYLNDGIYADIQTTIVNNYIRDINNAGIYVMGDEESKITGNTIKSCKHGILVSKGNARIANNNITENTESGILFAEAKNVTVIGNKISDTLAPLRCNNKTQSTNAYVMNNYLSGITYGLTLINTGVVNITNNYIETTANVGIYLNTNKTEEIIMGNEVKTKDITSSSIAIWSTDGSGKRIYIGNILYAKTNIMADGEVIAIGNNGDGAKDYQGASPLIKNNVMNGTVYALNTTTTS